MKCPNCSESTMRIVFWNLHAKVEQLGPILVVYQCPECKRVDIAIE